MIFSPDAQQPRFRSIQAQAHPFCLVCRQSNPLGLGLKFIREEDGSVAATFLGHPALEGFQGLLHGGVIGSLLDGAMTNCLFAHSRTAMTGELNVRYREPVVIGEEMRIRGWITRSSPPLPGCGPRFRAVAAPVPREPGWFLRDALQTAGTCATSTSSLHPWRKRVARSKS